MSHFKLAVAQIAVKKGAIATNIREHLRVIQQASAHQVSYLVFPELSLTGYEPELAGQLAITDDDSCLELFKGAAVLHQMFIVVGAPLKGEGKPYIGALIFTPEGNVLSYRKMNLHPGEDLFFQPGKDLQILNINKVKVGNGICADMNSEHHAQQYAVLGADIYVAGVLITEGGYADDTAKMAADAEQFNMLVAMANYNHPTGGWYPIGCSGIWSPEGLLVSANEIDTALVIAEKTAQGWQGEVRIIPDAAVLNDIT
ncbi:carbon-nitrogen hydrolase family protein [Oceanospirillum beijerinckii]|uniref:carbon-nitrogen hydrolase family protein n=1 Tax=Oceanospirillum beijerinckii TaxID=64976 RepID=UPI000404EA0B|nr:carbon-nitrogen hydrolase family protein [Oceanospirillum beijerinckii]